MITDADRKAAEDYAQLIWFIQHNAIGSDPRQDIREVLEYKRGQTDGFLAGIEHERKRMREGKPDGYIMEFRDFGATRYSDDVPQGKFIPILIECPVDDNTGWRIVPVKLVEMRTKPNKCGVCGCFLGESGKCSRLSYDSYSGMWEHQ